ncbi:MAG: FAD-dependent oxidoreductase, partial [Bacilli bacterium]
LQTPLFYKHAYVVPRGGNQVLIGATMEVNEWETTFTADHEKWLREKTRGFFPQIVSFEIIEQWCGLRPANTEEWPIVKRNEQDGRIIFNTGHYRNGILLAPICADIVTQMIESDLNFSWEMGGEMVAR